MEIDHDAKIDRDQELKDELDGLGDRFVTGGMPKMTTLEYARGFQDGYAKGIEFSNQVHAAKNPKTI